MFTFFSSNRERCSLCRICTKKFGDHRCFFLNLWSPYFWWSSDTFFILDLIENGLKNASQEVGKKKVPAPSCQKKFRWFSLPPPTISKKFRYHHHQKKVSPPLPFFNLTHKEFFNTHKYYYSMRIIHWRDHWRHGSNRAMPMSLVRPSHVCLRKKSLCLAKRREIPKTLCLQRAWKSLQMKSCYSFRWVIFGMSEARTGSRMFSALLASKTAIGWSGFLETASLNRSNPGTVPPNTISKSPQKMEALPS